VHIAGLMVVMVIALIGLASVNQTPMNDTIRATSTIPFKRAILPTPPTVDESIDMPSAAASPVRVDFYVMSKCPDAKFCENLWGPALSPLSSIITADMNYFGEDNGGGAFNCMHGASECEGNVQQLCVKNMTSPSLKWMDFAICQSSTQGSIPHNAKDCAKQLQLDYDVIDHCATGPLGRQLFSESIAKRKASGATKSCTLQLDDRTWCVRDGVFKSCNEGNTAADLTKAICERYQGASKPSACA